VRLVLREPQHVVRVHERVDAGAHLAEATRDEAERVVGPVEREKREHLLREVADREDVDVLGRLEQLRCRAAALHALALHIIIIANPTRVRCCCDGGCPSSVRGALY
jgi:hypothetical protein